VAALGDGGGVPQVGRHVAKVGRLGHRVQRLVVPQEGLLRSVLLEVVAQLLRGAERDGDGEYDQE
jgi:hypothetical protein